MGCILKFLLFIFILGFIGVVRFWWTIRTLVHNAREQARQQQQGGQHDNFKSTSNASSANTTSSTNTASSASHKKVFADNEGEYVEFEEVKD